MHCVQNLGFKFLLSIMCIFQKFKINSLEFIANLDDKIRCEKKKSGDDYDAIRYSINFVINNYLILEEANHGC